MAAYLVIDTDWKDTDTETRMAYSRVAQPVIGSYGGRFLTRPGGPAEPLEGDWNPQVLTILEFPDAATARQLWNSLEYRSAFAIRQATNAVFKAVLVDGAAA